MFYNQPAGKPALGGAGGVVSVLDLVYSLAKGYQEYQQIREQETTRRCQIEAWKQTTLADIEAKRQFLMAYLRYSFDERERNFQQLFECIDRAIACGNNAQLALLLDSLVKYAQTSPFSQLADLAQVQANLADPDYVWEL
ncbi:hypothetical protein [Thermosynechococcus sp. FA-CM-4201]